MSTTRVQTYVSGSGWRPLLPSVRYGGVWKSTRAVWVWVSNWVPHIIGGDLVYVDEGGWKLVVTLLAPSASNNSVVASLVGGVFSHQLNFSWTSYNEQTFDSGIVHVYLNGSQITQFGFSAGTSHSENYTLPDAYGTTGGDVTAKVAYLPSAGSTEGTYSPASNTINVVPWL